MRFVRCWNYIGLPLTLWRRQTGRPRPTRPAHGWGWVSNRLRQAAIGPSLAVGAFADSTYVLNGRVDELAIY